MQNYQKLTVFAIFSVLLFSQISLVAFAHHNDDTKKEARQEAETKTKQVNNENKEKDKKIKDAWNEYRNSFKFWKIAKENYKEKVSNGNQVEIDSAKNILDQAILDVTKALNEYQKIKKENR